MDKKTIGIVTIDDYTNYGNRLQNYALTKLFENEGFQVYNGIQVYTKEDWVHHTASPVKKLMKQLTPFSVAKGKFYPQPKAKEGLLGQRQQRFTAFLAGQSRQIPHILAPTHKKAMEMLAPYGIDSFVTGSDQVWNPNYEGRAHEFLAFAPRAMRNSFAASIGASQIPPEARPYYGQYLSQMNYISVREERAAELVKELSGRDARLTLDPTLLLDREDWTGLVRRPQAAPDGPFICTYFLGELPPAVHRFAAEKDLPLCRLNDRDCPDLFTCHPGEFLYMIQNAAYVLTDSFHAVAFSIKFRRNFYVFDRVEAGVESMFSRIETITRRFRLENRIQSRDAIAEQPEISHWDAIDRELAREKARSMAEILDAMGVQHG